MAKRVTHDEMLRLLHNLARPIDFDFLVAEGVLTRRGAWFEVDNLHQMPAYMRQQITDVQTDGTGGVRVKFGTDRDKVRRLLDELTPKPRRRRAAAPPANGATDADPSA
jgi:hypothetical protein